MLKRRNLGFIVGLVFPACLIAVTLSPISQADNVPKPPSTQPVQLSIAKQFTDSSDTALELARYTVPANKRLVIEFASLLAQIPDQEVVTFFIETTVNGITATHYVSIASKVWERSFWGGQQLKLYADSETPVTIKAFRFSLCTNGGCPDNLFFYGAISGYLENLL